MKKLFCTLLSAAAAVALLCGFTPSPQENSAGAGLITKTYETAAAISSLSVSDKYADVTVKADDVDHVVVEYSYNSSYNDAFGTGGELYSFTIAGPSLNIQGLKGDASMSVNNSKCSCTMTVKLPRRAFAGLTVDTSNGNLTIQDMTSQSNTLTTTNVNSRGFTAVMVSWMSKFNPFIMIASSLLLVTMDRGASEVASTLSLNHSFADILTGIILFFIIATEFFITYKVTLRKSSRKEA